MNSRRDFLKVASIAGAYFASSASAFQKAKEQALGLLLPPMNFRIPSDADRLYSKGVVFLGNGIGLRDGMTLESYDEAIPKVLPAAEALAKQGAKVISVFGSSLTFYKGAKFNQELAERVSRLTGVPGTTQSNGLVDGLRIANAKRVAVATAYTDVITERLKIFLGEHGFDVTFTKGLGYERIPEGAATQEILLKFGLDVYAKSNKADALLISCGALQTLDLIVPLENEIKVPVVSSTPHGLMNAVRLLGSNPKVQGFGMILERA
jgi:arylmalonate decarboxylase